MKSVLQQVILDNTVQSYLICIGIILLLLTVKRYLARYISHLFFGLLRKTPGSIEKDVFVNLLKGPIHVFLVLGVIFLVLDKLHFPSALNFRIHRVPFKDILDSTGVAVLIIAFIWLLLRLIDFLALILERQNPTSGLTDNSLIVFFKDFFKVILMFIGFLMVVRFAFNKDIAPLLAGFGIVGAALALSARESLENLIASFIIFFDKPFSPGDVVKVQNVTGAVERIGLRSTRIRTDQKTYVTVPNKQMVDSILDNLTLRTQRKAAISLELSASTPYEAVEELISGIDGILDEKKELIESKSVVLADISKNSFLLQVEFFTGDIPMDVFNSLRQDVNLKVIRMMEDMKIRLAGKETEVVIRASNPQELNVQAADG